MVHINKVADVRLFIVAMVALIGILAGSMTPTLAASRKDKKVIEFGWDWAYLDQIANPQQLAQMEKLPFDGICFRINKERVKGFSSKLWEDKDFPAKKLKSIHWGKFTDNFIIYWPASKGFSWYDDAHWKVILHNARQYSRAVQLSGSVGIFFDPEATYGNGPLGDWKYRKSEYGGKTYEQVATLLRKRGWQFMKALQSHKPDIKILAFLMWQQFTYTRQALNAPAGKRNVAMEGKNVKYSLWLPFLEGMMKAAGPKVQIIDGNEWGYYDISAKAYEHGYKHSIGNYRALIPQSLRQKMAGQMQIGMPLYVDQVLALRVPTKWAPPLSQYLSKKDRIKLFKYQLYQTLKYSDQYVWVYSERMNWWPDNPAWQKDMMAPRHLTKGLPAPDKSYIPDGLTKALRTAITKYKQGKPIEVNGLKLIKKAKANKKAAKASH